MRHRVARDVVMERATALACDTANNVRRSAVSVAPLEAEDRVALWQEEGAHRPIARVAGKAEHVDAIEQVRNRRGGSHARRPSEERELPLVANAHIDARIRREPSAIQGTDEALRRASQIASTGGRGVRLPLDVAVDDAGGHAVV